MIYPKTGGAFSATMRLVAVGFLAAGVCLAVPASASTQKPSKPASAPAPNRPPKPLRRQAILRMALQRGRMGRIRRPIQGVAVRLDHTP